MLYQVTLLAIAMTVISSSSEAQSPTQFDPQASDSLQYLDPQNAARSEVGVAPLTWDEELAAYAGNYSSQRAKDCKLIHSQGPYGENLSMSTGDMSIAEAVKLWTDEKADYDYNSNTCAPGKQCAHYTQLVWRKTTEVGCARVECNNGGTFVSCNYYPRGNYIGEKPY